MNMRMKISLLIVAILLPPAQTGVSVRQNGVGNTKTFADVIPPKGHNVAAAEQMTPAIQ